MSLSRRALSAVALFFAFAFAIVLSFWHAQRPIMGSEGTLRIWFFDVGQGDAILLEAPDGTQLLIDAGPDASVLAKLGAVLPPTDRTIDAILLTHPDADHLGGFPAVFDRYVISTVYETGLECATVSCSAFESARDAEGAARVLLSRGDHFDIGHVTLAVLSPEEKLANRIFKDTNASSLVLLVRYGNTQVLLTGDASTQEEAVYQTFAGDVDVLKVGHHGSLSSTGSEFLDMTRPETAVISVGAENTYGHPHPAVLERLVNRDVRVFRTDRDSDVLLTSQGSEPSVVSAPLPF